MAPTRPHLRCVSHPITGHLTPTLRVAAALAARAWPVCFVAPPAHRARIAAAHPAIVFAPLLGAANLDDARYYDPENAVYWSLPWRQRGLLDLAHTWVDAVPDEWRSIVAALRMLRQRDQAARVVLVAEATFLGIMPLFCGAELPPGVAPPARTAALSVTVPFIRSDDVPAFFVDRDHDDDRREAAWRRLAECTDLLRVRLERKLVEAGAAPADVVAAQLGADAGGHRPFLLVTGQNYLCHDAIVQLGVPGFFYPRSDWPAHFSFAGVLPPAEAPAGGWPNLPGWWDEVADAATGERRKKIVVVAQGTVEVDPNDLIVPTVRAMAARCNGDDDDNHNAFVVAILGRKGAVLPGGLELPANARVVDHLHYDAVLPYASVWVHNGGYGAVQHGIAHGVPMIIAGEGQDKAENAKRVARCGAGVYLGGPAPGVEAVRAAVGAVLGNKSFRSAAETLRRQSEELSCFDAIERVLLGLVG